MEAATLLLELAPSWPKQQYVLYIHGSLNPCHPHVIKTQVQSNCLFRKQIKRAQHLQMIEG